MANYAGCGERRDIFGRVFCPCVECDTAIQDLKRLALPDLTVTPEQRQAVGDAFSGLYHCLKCGAYTPPRQGKCPKCAGPMEETCV
jgi:hypothetical protein